MGGSGWHWRSQKFSKVGGGKAEYILGRISFYRVEVGAGLVRYHGMRQRPVKKNQVQILGTSHVGRGIWEIWKGRGWEGVSIPLPHQETFAFLDLKISDLVHTFGEFLKYCLTLLPIHNLRRKYSSQPVLYLRRCIRHITRRSRNPENMWMEEGVGLPLPHQGVFAF